MSPEPDFAPAPAFAYTAVFDPAPEGGYVVTFPALPGLVTEGETLEEARSMAADALRCYLEGHLEDGLPILLLTPFPPSCNSSIPMIQSIVVML